MLKQVNIFYLVSQKYKNKICQFFGGFFVLMKLFCQFLRYYSKEGKILSIQISENDFEKIYQETYLSTLKFITIRCYDLEDVNDILQDTYVEFYKVLLRKKKLILEKSESFINGIAKNVIKRHFSKKRNLVSLVNDDGENIEIADDFNVEQDFITKENAKKIFHYIKNKDLLTAKTFYLYFIFGMKISEIAEELVLSQSNVKNKIYRTLKELKEILGKEEGENEK